MDLSLSIRFANLTNNAQLEMKVRSGPREDQPVTIAVQSETGKREQAQFTSSESLYDVISTTIGVPATKASQDVVCIYMRKEIIGQDALRNTTLKSLGLMSGSAMVRVIVRESDVMKTQAHVEHLKLKKPAEASKTSEVVSDVKQNVSKFGKSLKKMVSGVFDSVTPGPSGSQATSEPQKKGPTFTASSQRLGSLSKAADNNGAIRAVVQTIRVPDPEDDQVINWLGEREGLLFRLEDMAKMRSTGTNEDLNDEFFEHTHDDMLLIYNDLKQQMREMDDRPLETEALREKKKTSTRYNKTVLRICFPADGLVLQATFSPNDTIQTVRSFVTKYLRDPSHNFYLYTTPPKQVLESADSLIKKNLVPAAMVQFGQSDPGLPVLKTELFSQITSFHAIAAATTEMRRQITTRAQPSAGAAADTSVQGTETGTPTAPSPKPEVSRPSATEQKVPKWFKKKA